MSTSLCCSLSIHNHNPTLNFCDPTVMMISPALHEGALVVMMTTLTILKMNLQVNWQETISETKISVNL